MTRDKGVSAVQLEAALEDAIRRRKAEKIVIDEGLESDVVDYWFGELGPERQRSFLESMDASEGLAEYVLEVGAALERAGFIDTGEPNVLVFQPRQHPFVTLEPSRPALVARGDQHDVEYFEAKGIQLTTVVKRGSVEVVVATATQPSVPLANAEVVLTRLGSEGDSEDAAWSGLTDHSGRAVLQGRAKVEPPLLGEAYELTVTMPAVDEGRDAGLEETE